MLRALLERLDDVFLTLTGQPDNDKEREPARRARSPMGTAIGDSAGIAVAWCSAITPASYLWARKLYNRDPIR